MVYLKNLKQELTHLTQFAVFNPAMAVTVVSVQGTTEFQIFDKSDVIINKIEKLPVMTSIKLIASLAAALAEQMSVSGVEVLTVGIAVHNANAAQIAAENLIYRNNLIINLVGAANMYLWQSDVSEEHFSELLTDTISVRIDIAGNDAVGVAEIQVAQIGMVLCTEINWVKVSEQELKEYALEHLYVNM